ncbi:response regulator receiver:CheW-like protein:ATP-binding region, ATPase-like:Hpt [Pandoraea terrae]|uniref:Response regulator receiver:CheW-like protein:ATP-binding region, ATPase-like:Hpt n=1 Tax=Pandoraea terrae TaxID=1537710 RepID=A0A5E4TLV3_9BURK|nr:hypothetical protein [Pandoraea terrae]VVD88880.1 response regulator receiver:CheW-like protein:ATP-binding region, ATPase-like:Hpt [Pandoraea terrae]
MTASPDNTPPRDNPLWRLPDVAAALTDASDAWSSGAAAALGPLRRANRMLQTSGHADWALQGECLVQAIAEAAYGSSASTDALRNALREFEREVWRAGAPPAESVRVWPGAPTAGETMAAGWPLARARTGPMSGAAAPLRAGVERALLRLLRADSDAAQTAVALGHLHDLASDLHRLGGSAPLDFWRLAAAWLSHLRTLPAPLSLHSKRLAGKMNLVLRRQLTPPEPLPAGPEAAPIPERTDDPGRDMLLCLATWQAQVPSTGHERLLADFGILRRSNVLPPALAGAGLAEDKQNAGLNPHDWLRFGPLAVRLDVCQAFLSLADEALPNLSDPAVVARVADYAGAIGLAPVARLAAALAATGERLAAHPAAKPGGPAALAVGVKALRGMLHQFAADAYPDTRPDLIADLGQWREGALDAAAVSRRLATGDGDPC